MCFFKTFKLALIGYSFFKKTLTKISLKHSFLICLNIYTMFCFRKTLRKFLKYWEKWFHLGLFKKIIIIIMIKTS